MPASQGTVCTLYQIACHSHCYVWILSCIACKLNLKLLVAFLACLHPHMLCWSTCTYTVSKTNVTSYDVHDAYACAVGVHMLLLRLIILDIHSCGLFANKPNWVNMHQTPTQCMPYVAYGLVGLCTLLVNLQYKVYCSESSFKSYDLHSRGFFASTYWSQPLPQPSLLLQ